MRTVPVLAFRYDAGIERGARMFELLREEEKMFPAQTDDRPAEDELPMMTEEDFAAPTPSGADAEKAA